MSNGRSPPDIVHVDLDAFYASVESRRDGTLSGRPLIVGAGGPRGVVMSCSYEARALGVRNGMPSVRARRLAPSAVFVPPDFDAYRAASRAFMAILESFTPLVEPLSLDEAFCDVAGAHRLFGDTDAIAAAVRAETSGALGLSCSVGAGPSKLVAKMASRDCKPDGVLVVRAVEGFLRDRPVSDLWGVGQMSAEALRRAGVRTIGQLAQTPTGVLRGILGESAAVHLRALAQGGDDRTVVVGHEAKSVGAEETFDADLDDEERIAAELLRLSDRVASRLTAAGLSARTFTVKIRLEGFETFTRSRTAGDPAADVWTVHRLAREAYEAFSRGRRRVRLLGVTATGIVRGPAPRQPSLEDGPDFERAREAMARVRDRFGRDALGMARLVEPRGDDAAVDGPGAD